MRIVVAPNALKGSLTAVQAAAAISRGLVSALPAATFDLAPISDGGDGFLDAMAIASGRRLVRQRLVVRGPVHSPVSAAFGIDSERRVVVEAAQADGIALLGADLDPLRASTGGVGELLAEARQGGGRSYLVGVGGSACTDGGTGMARALGYRFLDATGHELAEGGGSLTRLARIDPGDFDPAWLLLKVAVACDVDSPLVGPAGAAAVYGPQKGASPAQVVQLAEGLDRLAEVVRRDLGVDIGGIAGGGAAGGLAGGLVAFLGATLEPGAATVLEAIELVRRLAAADLLVTSEGRLDGQSLNGKAPVEAARAARRAGVPAACLAAVVGVGWEAAAAEFDDFATFVPAGMSGQEGISRAEDLLEAAAVALGGRVQRRELGG